jgi:hypothetical protein
MMIFQLLPELLYALFFSLIDEAPERLILR